MPSMRTPWLVVWAGLVALGVPIVLAAFLKGGHHAPATVEPSAAPARVGSAVVFAREDGSDALAVAAGPQTIRITLLGPDGKGVSGRSVTVAGIRADACGKGCYAARTSARGTVPVAVDGRRFDFTIPTVAPNATALIDRATKAFRSLRSVTYTERLASSTRDHIVTTFTLEAPDRIAYRIHGGADAVVIGTKRWDRTPGAKWVESQSTVLPQPTPVWGFPVTDAHVLARTRKTIVISFLNPGIPAWFEVRLDAQTMLPRRLDMIAVSHFMHHVYTAYNQPRRVFPPS